MKKIFLFGIFILFLCISAGGFLFAKKNKEAIYKKSAITHKAFALQSHKIQSTAPWQQNKEPSQKIPKGFTVTVPIFMYHHIREFTGTMTPLARGLSVTPESLEKQLQYFQKEGFTSLTLEEFTRHITTQEALPLKSVMFTFDDGYQDFYYNAFPLFKKYNIHAIVFIITHDVGTPDYLTWDQIHDMDTSGLIEFGSHTLTHLELSKESIEKQKEEIVQSKELLEKKLGKKIAFFCYPYGKYTQVTVNLVKDTGYEGAFTTHFGITHGLANAYEFPRVRIGDGDVDIHLQKKMEKLLGLKK